MNLFWPFSSKAEQKQKQVQALAVTEVSKRLAQEAFREQMRRLQAATIAHQTRPEK